MQQEGIKTVYQCWQCVTEIPVYIQLQIQVVDVFDYKDLVL